MGEKLLRVIFVTEARSLEPEIVQASSYITVKSSL